VHTRSHRHFTDNDVNFLRAIANILAETVARHQSEQNIRQINASLESRVEERTQQLVEVNQELEAFAYSVSHDLRAPLRAVEGLARILQEDYGPRLDATGQEYTQIMIDSASQMDRLIQDLLAYSQLGRREIQLVAVNLAVVVDEVLRDLRSGPTEFADQSPQVVVDPLPSVIAQRSILRQVVTNLLTNAVKFVKPDVTPTIHIWAEQGAAWTRIWIEDNGIGIAPRHQTRIFRPFDRLHGIEAYPGTGIGLAIVQRGVERMGGQVGVESTPGQGSRFWIELPKV
ncbi:MAG: ATP-binding protein, partial [Elainellaceae cyanobacterium]